MTRASVAGLGIAPDRADSRFSFLQWYAAVSMEEASRQEGRRRIVQYIEAATAFREAAMWAMALESAAIKELLRRSAAAYAEAGSPYQWYIRALEGLLGGDGLSQRERSFVTGQLLEALSGTTFEPREDPTWKIPQQQAYALWSLIQSGDRFAGKASHQSAYVIKRIQSSRLAGSTMPIGALSRPIREYITTGLLLLDSEAEIGFASGHDSITTFIQEQLSIAGRGMAAASLNHYLWENASAPVEIVDLDLVFIVAIGSREDLIDWRALAFAEDRSARFAQFQLEVALSAARPDEGPTRGVYA